MKVLHLIYTNAAAGAEKHLLYLLPGLQAQGVECEFICVTGKKTYSNIKHYSDEMELQGIKTTVFICKNYLDLFFIAKKINRYIINNNIDFIHSHLFLGDAIAVIIKTFFNRSVKILSTKHGYREDYLIEYGKGNKKPRKNIYYFISRFIIKRITANIAASRFIADMYNNLKLGEKKMKFIYHGIQIKKTGEENINIKGFPKIMIVGRLVKVKGHLFLIEAMPLLLKKFPSLKLLVLGEGNMQSELIKRSAELGLSDHIDFVGYQKPENYTPHCQVMVVPSLFEAFGMVFIEAFSLKIPVVAFNVGAGNEIITNNETGLLATPFSSESLAEKIIYLLQHAEERNKIAENAYDKFINDFTVEKMVAKTVQWYKSIR